MLERDSNTGQFAPGNQIAKGKGRPPKPYVDAFAAVVNEEDWRSVIKRALDDALKGDGVARAWLADRLIGKPPSIIDLRGSDALLLRDLLEVMAARGVAASALFQAMLVIIGGEDEPIDADSLLMGSGEYDE